MWSISGLEIIPIFFAYVSPNDLVIAKPGPSSSAQTLKGPTHSPLKFNFSILPPFCVILYFSSLRVGFWSQDNSIALISFPILHKTALESPKLDIVQKLSLMNKKLTHDPERL